MSGITISPVVNWSHDSPMTTLPQSDKLFMSGWGRPFATHVRLTLWFKG